MNEMVSLDDYIWSEQDVSQEKERIDDEASGNRVSWLKLQSGEAKVIRLLPPSKAAIERRKAAGSKNPNSLFTYAWRHTFTNPSTNKLVSFACPKYSSNGWCPVCDKVQQLLDTGSKADRDLAFSMKVKKKAYINVLERPSEEEIQDAIDAGLPEPTGQVKVWSMSASYGTKYKGKGQLPLQDKLLALTTKQKGSRNFGNIFDITETGYDVEIARTGSGREGTSYTVSLVHPPQPLHEDAEKAVAVIESQYDTDRYAVAPEMDQIKNMLTGNQENADAAPKIAARQRAQDMLDTGGTSMGSDLADFSSDLDDIPF